MGVIGRCLPVVLLSPLLVACASTPRGDATPGAARIEVENGGEYALGVRACSPDRCTEYVPLAAGARTSFTFPLPAGHRRFVVTGKDGDRVAAQVPLDLVEPGVSNVVLRPTPRPGGAGRKDR